MIETKSLFILRQNMKTTETTTSTTTTCDHLRETKKEDQGWETSSEVKKQSRTEKRFSSQRILPVFFWLMGLNYETKASLLQLSC